jgi:hypothetical protein
MFRRSGDEITLVTTALELGLLNGFSNDRSFGLWLASRETEGSVAPLPLERV